jgi:thiamine biosynthesis lipoprotein
MSGETSRCFRCFGGTVTVHVGGRGAERAVRMVEAEMLDAHLRLSRFEPASELSRLNEDQRRSVPVSPLMLELAIGVRRAGVLSDGLVDATQLREIEAAGYRRSARHDGFDPLTPESLAEIPAAPAEGSAERRWERVHVDRGRSLVLRPPGVLIDGGGIAKGLLADLLGARLEGFQTFAIDCCGDLRIGGRGGRPRTVLIDDPYGGPPIHELAVSVGGVATSGITRRAWRTDAGTAAHQLLDPSTGRPAFTGILQATALAPSAFEAEVLAKRALLSGSSEAAEKLPWGGVVVHADSRVEVVPRGGLPARALVWT